MNPDHLENMLASYAAQPLPRLSEPSAMEIWREIDRRRHRSIWARMFPWHEWRELLAEPRLAVAGVAFAVVIGIVPTFVLNRAEDERRLARQSIHFDVFAVHVSGLATVFPNPIGMAPSNAR